MKKLLIIAGFAAAVTVIVSCSDVRRNPGRAYMPDMAYSVAYETYAPAQERLSESAHAKNELAPHYNGRPVDGTIARGELAPYKFKNDSLGYQQSATVTNPLAPGSFDLKEAERLYLINCAICHGAKLDGNGPLYKGGDGPYGAKPATLVGDATYEAMPEGRMYHSVTYGKGQMGSYASQLNSTQRWMVVAYVKSKQNGGKGAPAGGGAAGTIDSTAAKTAGADTTMVAK